MIKEKNILIAVGGTGGHVLPGINLADHLKNMKFQVQISTDKRGYKYLEQFKSFKISILPSSPLNSGSLKLIFFSSFLIFYSILRSIVFLILNRPKIIFGMGGYASFPICIAAYILRIKFIIYENNLIIGKANKILLPFSNRILVSKKELEGIPKKYSNKVFEIGNIINKEIIFFSNKADDSTIQKLNILVLGGSQAAKIFAEILPNIFKQCIISGVNLKIYQQCMPSQNEYLKNFYKTMNIEYEIFNFSTNLIKYFSKVNLAITRSGSSMLAELTNVQIPFVSVPLPTSKDNHQLKNAFYYQRKDLSFLVEEKDLNKKLYSLIKEIYHNRSLLDKITINQSQFSDKNVYENISKILNEILDEKN